LFPGGEFKGARFLDIGCGSGLSMVAALRLGAALVAGIDIDPESVATTRAVLTRFAAPGTWQVVQGSVLDFPAALGRDHDIVHSWGVLHHTGDLWRAVAAAAALVRPGGLIALALYRRTPFCGFWRAEKRVYAHAPRPVQALIGGLYKAAYLAGLLLTGRNPMAYIRNYHGARGMDWHHDVHDWLGGYPYESASPEEIRARLAGLGFDMVREFTHEAAAKGIFGSHCDEYVARRSR
jgi:SAM-dependent methyltransferase